MYNSTRSLRKIQASAMRQRKGQLLKPENILNKHKQQLMTSPCKQKIKHKAIQVFNAGKYVKPNIGNEAQIMRHRTLNYICNQNHRPKKGNDKISHARKKL